MLQYIYRNFQINNDVEITLEDIWIKGTFKTEAVAGFRSMNDGNYYTEINEKKELQKVSFQDGKVVEILADFSNILCKGKKVNVDEYILKWGRHKNKSVSHIKLVDEKYIEWLKNNKFVLEKCPSLLEALK